MNFSEKKRNPNASWRAVAAMLALSLAACGEKPPAETAGKKIDQAVAKAGEEMKQAAGAAKEKIEQAKEVISEKAAETGKAVADAALAAKVKTALIAEPGLTASAIDVDAKDGVVSLFGTADNTTNRDKAGQVASKVEGVKSVNNKLVIAKGS